LNPAIAVYGIAASFSVAISNVAEPFGVSHHAAALRCYIQSVVVIRSALSRFALGNNLPANMLCAAGIQRLLPGGD
jgi:hypothetical protein